MKSYIFTSIALALFLVVMILPSVSYSWLGGWSYRKQIDITSYSTVNNYQLRLNITYNSHMQTDFDDIRFTDTSDNLLSYWLDEKSDGNWAVFWVKVNLTNTSIYMYYGNSTVSTVSNISTTFVFGDDASSDRSDEYSYNTNIYLSDSSGTITYDTSNSYYKLEGTINYHYHIFPTDAENLTNFCVYLHFKMESDGTNPYMGPGMLDNSGNIVHHSRSGIYTGGVHQIMSWTSSSYSILVDHSVSSGISKSTWYYDEICYDGSTLTSRLYNNSKYSLDNASTSVSFTNRVGSIYYFIDNTGTTGSVYGVFDLLYIRKYTSPEPTYSIGTEQSDTGLVVELISPDDESVYNTSSNPYTFKPVSYVGVIYNCSLYTNESGTWQAVETITSVENNTNNIINHAISTSGTYKWSVGCYNSTTLFMADENRTILINDPPSEPVSTYPDTDGQIISEADHNDFEWDASTDPEGDTIRYIGWLVNDTGTYQIFNTTATSYNFNSSEYADGDYEYRLQACDPYFCSTNDTVNITIDNTPPTVSIIVPEDGSSYSDTEIPLNYTYSDAGSGVYYCEYAIDDTNSWYSLSSGGQPCQNTTLTNLSTGAHTVYVRVKDHAEYEGNDSSTFTIVLVGGYGQQANATTVEELDYVNYSLGVKCNPNYAYNYTGYLWVDGSLVAEESADCLGIEWSNVSAIARMGLVSSNATDISWKWNFTVWKKDGTNQSYDLSDNSTTVYYGIYPNMDITINGYSPVNHLSHEYWAFPYPINLFMQAWITMKPNATAQVYVRYRVKTHPSHLENQFNSIELSGSGWVLANMTFPISYFHFPGYLGQYVWYDQGNITLTVSYNGSEFNRTFTGLKDLIIAKFAIYTSYPQCGSYYAGYLSALTIAQKDEDKFNYIDFTKHDMSCIITTLGGNYSVQASGSGSPTLEFYFAGNCSSAVADNEEEYLWSLFAYYVGKHNSLIKATCFTEYSASESLGYNTRHYVYLADPLVYDATKIVYNCNSTSYNLPVSVVDEFKEPQEGVYIILERWYPATGSYMSVDGGITGDAGTTAVHVKLDGTYYRFRLIRNNEVIMSTSKTLFTSNDIDNGYTIVLVEGESSEAWQSFKGVLLNWTWYDNDTFVAQIVDPHGQTTEGQLLIGKIEGFQSTLVCNSSGTGSSMTLICDMTGENKTANTYMLKFYAKIGGKWYLVHSEVIHEGEGEWSDVNFWVSIGAFALIAYVSANVGGIPALIFEQMLVILLYWLELLPLTLTTIFSIFLVVGIVLVVIGRRVA